MLLICHFHRTRWNVELEKDLAVKRQLLDVLIIRRTQGEDLPRLPDGLEDMAAYNLLTYKSLREPLDDWALKELTGHYVNYRKLISPSLDALLPESDFRLYAVSTRFPQKLSGEVQLTERSQGVYEVARGSDRTRVVVLSQIPKEEHNAPWLILSGDPELVDFGRRHERGDIAELGAIIQDLFQLYQLEGIAMPYTLDDYRREVAKEHLKDLTIEERLEGLSPEEVEKWLRTQKPNEPEQPKTERKE